MKERARIILSRLIPATTSVGDFTRHFKLFFKTMSFIMWSHTEYFLVPPSEPYGHSGELRLFLCTLSLVPRVVLAG